MSSLFKKVRKAFDSKKPMEYTPTSSLERFAEVGLRPLIMTEQLENRVALITAVKGIISDVFAGITLEQQLEAIDRAVQLICVASMPWGRGGQVWHTWSAQFRELRTMPAFMDSMVEEFMDMINHGWLPADVIVQVPIVMFAPMVGNQGIDMTTFQKSAPP